MRVAILDDYQSVAFEFGDWESVKEASVVSFADHVHDPDDLVARLSDFDAVFRMRERTPLPRTVLERLPRLRLILATGIRNADSIDLPAARELGITVCSTGALQRETVEITWGLIISLMRGLNREIASVRAGGWQLGVGRRLTGKTLGIVGFGTMGVPVARVARAFEMDVLAWSPNLTQERIELEGVRAVSKAELFSASDVVTIHMPYSARSHGVVGREDIERMSPRSYLVNTSRPGLVDHEALLDALAGSRLGGYGVDVYDHEPLPQSHPFRILPNVVASPHIGYVTQENYALFFGESVENLRNFIKGTPSRVIN